MKKLSNIKDIKVLATLGPTSMEKNIVQKMDSAGVDIFRINLSHTEIKDFENIVKNIRSWTRKPICVDTEGAQIRTGRIKNGSRTVKNNSILSLTSAEIPGDGLCIPLYPVVPQKILQPGDILAIDFNSVVVQVVRIEKGKVWARVLSGGKIGSNKGVGFSGQIELPAFTKKDLKAMTLSKKMGLTYFALSFAAKKEDVRKLRDFFPYPVFVISKIESKQGLANLRDICKASDAILIDRGDLSREVPLYKIALAQKHILDVAGKIGVPVFVATNLLESMVNNFEPTRAEINDITSTLFSGARGLVLAAETAIGKYPVQSVRMTSGIKKEVENFITVRNKDACSKDYLNTVYDYNLIEPHGGVLIQNFIKPDKIENFKKLPKIDVDDRILSDIIQIAEGTYSPLKGFMNLEELISVLEHYRLPAGPIWTLPILFQLNKKSINFGKRATLAIRREKDKNFYALMKVSDVQKIDIPRITKKWFGTDDPRHPGVSEFTERGDYIISGEVFLIKKSPLHLDSYNLTPKQARQVFQDCGWQKIVGFHTRNVIHRGHEFIQKKALDMVGADALFISPVVGQKKGTDFSAQAILKSYEIMLKNNYYSPCPALIGTFNTFSRYSGPREAVFTALCRKNFGCSHFIVGRDHTGVGNYYSYFASQRLFDKLGDIGIKPLMFNTVYYCKACQKVTDGCQHLDREKLSLSGTEVSKYLLKGLRPPKYLIREDISKELQKMARGRRGKLFEKRKPPL